MRGKRHWACYLVASLCSSFVIALGCSGDESSGAETDAAEDLANESGLECPILDTFGLEADEEVIRDGLGRQVLLRRAERRLFRVRFVSAEITRPC